MDALAIIDKYYPEAGEPRQLLMTHSRLVAGRALRVCREHPELHLDCGLVERGALLHDIGIRFCDAPGIHCHGTEHYLFHGIIGARLVRSEGQQWEAEARICERHTGTGLRREAFLSRGLLPPATDLLPETIEEQVICYADKFFSKSRPEEEKTPEEAARSVSKFGEEQAARFWEWHALFG
ncbi:MAG: HDIG domain-containing protein [Alloprevotella sp.]|nr:HDIG domain-containing protein [Alloprevotella sp.]